MRRWVPGVLIVAAFAFSAAVYPRLPERVPVHRGPSGEVDGWAGRGVGAFALPAILLAGWGLLRLLPRLDPRRENYAKFAGTYDLMVAVILAFLLALQVATLGVGLGWDVSVPRVAWVGMGVMLTILGNVLPRARPNWFFGIRTPWTLSNDRVWERTHRVGGYLFIAAGLLIVVVALGDPARAFALGIATLLVTTVLTLGYSYVAWRREVRER